MIQETHGAGKPARTGHPWARTHGAGEGATTAPSPVAVSPSCGERSAYVSGPVKIGRLVIAFESQMHPWPRSCIPSVDVRAADSGTVLEKVDKHGPMPVLSLSEGNCWLCDAARMGGGYTSFGLTKTVVRQGHIVAWEWEHERALPEGLVLDHMCRRRRCVRPSHLRLVTPTQNAENRDLVSTNARSGLRNVHWQGRERKWRAQVGSKYTLHVGPMRDTIAEATADARQLRLRHHTHNDVDRVDHDAPEDLELTLPGL